MFTILALKSRSALESDQENRLLTFRKLLKGQSVLWLKLNKLREEEFEESREKLKRKVSKSQNRDVTRTTT